MKALKTKTKYLGLMGVAAMLLLGLGSCSNDDTANDTGDAQSLVIKLPNNVVLGRAVELPVADQTEAEVSNIRAYLIIGDKVFNSYEFTDDEITAGEKRIELVPAGVNKVILLANVPDDATVSDLATAAAIKEYAFSINSQNKGLGGIDDKVMMGEDTPVAAGTATDGHDYKTVDVALNALTARMEVGTVKAGKNIKSVELVGVWINDFYKDGSKADIQYNNSGSSYWNITPDPNTASPSATEFTGTITIPSYAPYAVYQNNASGEVTLYNSKVYAFHVFAGVKVPHLILLVKGEYEDDYNTDGKNYFLGWVTYTQFLKSNGSPITSMDANYIYKIGVGVGTAGDGNTDGGIEINAEDITPDPEMLFDLGIKVTITPWTAMEVKPSLY